MDMLVLKSHVGVLLSFNSH